jgi:hypothetical protein
MPKTPPIGGALRISGSVDSYAARLADSVAAAAASGTGPQIYAENIGVGSVLSPLEMMMPSGSDDSISLRSFFINSLTLCLPHRGAPAIKAADMPSEAQQRNILLTKGL